MDEDVLQVARAWALALDTDDYSEAGRWMAEECHYEMRGQIVRGRDAILASYRDASARGRAVLDEVRFESQVASVSDGVVTVRFTDILTHKTEVYVHGCEQVVHVSAGRIVRIEHRDLPGERERLSEFLVRVGVVL